MTKQTTVTTIELNNVTAEEVVQTNILASQEASLHYLGLQRNAGRSAIIAAFENKRRQMLNGGEEDVQKREFLAKLKETILPWKPGQMRRR